MKSFRAPRSLSGATGLLERFSLVDGEIAAIEGERDRRLAVVNAEADQALGPKLEERDALRQVLAPWWKDAAAELTKGKRKSIELGGCIVGTRKSRASLAIAGEEDDALTELKALAWARKTLVRVRYSIDRAAALKALDGPRKAVLAQIGLSREEGEDVFFVERAEQPGTLA